jgi:hypothetical protein
MGRVKVVSNPKFNTTNNPYELQFEANSDIRPCQDDGDIGKVIQSLLCGNANKFHIQLRSLTTSPRSEISRTMK